jgi:hypothetical protein
MACRALGTEHIKKKYESESYHVTFLESRAHRLPGGQALKIVHVEGHDCVLDVLLCETLSMASMDFSRHSSLSFAFSHNYYVRTT